MRALWRRFEWKMPIFCPKSQFLAGSSHAARSNFLQSHILVDLTLVTYIYSSSAFWIACVHNDCVCTITDAVYTRAGVHGAGNMRRTRVLARTACISIRLCVHGGIDLLLWVLNLVHRRGGEATPAPDQMCVVAGRGGTVRGDQSRGTPIASIHNGCMVVLG
jgi:hypothetical protein